MSFNNHGTAQKSQIKDGKIQHPCENFSPFWEHEIAIMTFWSRQAINSITHGLLLSVALTTNHSSIYVHRSTLAVGISRMATCIAKKSLVTPTDTLSLNFQVPGTRILVFKQQIWCPLSTAVGQIWYNHWCIYSTYTVYAVHPIPVPTPMHSKQNAAHWCVKHSWITHRLSGQRYPCV